MKTSITQRNLIIFFIITFLSFYLISCSDRAVNTAEIPRSPNAKMQEIYWADVNWTKGFWADKFELNQKEIIPAVYKGLTIPDNSANIDNFKVTAGVEEGEFKGLDWSDGDCYKYIESMAYVYAVTKDPKLDSAMNYWIELIGKSQLSDGYISTNMQMKKREPYMQHPNPKTMSGQYHEIYNQGHLLTAACTHYRATGKDKFLNIARKLADHMEKVFKPGVPELRVMVGNLTNIMGMIDMYRVTGEKRYLDAAQIGIDIRGTLPVKNDVSQDRVPFREEDQAAGHAVFATYLYAGAADVFAETGDQSLLTALNRIWESAELRRTYITGAAGSFRSGLSARGDMVWEGFGADYQLPNRTAYTETCANIGNAMWNWRMLLLTGDAKYTDIMETVLYNSMLSGVSADGSNFFYVNPLKWDFEPIGKTIPKAAERQLKIGFCCPPNLTRTIAGLGKWAYSVSNDTIWVHLFGGNTLNTQMPDGSSLSLEQESQYPWDGEVKITFNKVQKKALTVMVRIPGWAEEASALKINGQDIQEPLKPSSYVAISRKWKPGDVIDLNLPMPVRLMEANPNVADNRNCVAVTRGPVVYCAEFPTNENGDEIWKNGVFLSENVVLTAKTEKDLFGGVVVLTGNALTTKECEEIKKMNQPDAVAEDSTGWEDVLYRKFTPRSIKTPEAGTVDITLIPYYSWANRGPAYMAVWIPLAGK